MTATVAGIHLGLDTHANRPAANTAPDGSLYSCSTHNLVYKSNFAGNSWATWGTLSGGSGSVATDTIWDAAGDLVQGTGADAAAKLSASTTAGQFLMSNGSAAAVSWASRKLDRVNFTSPVTINQTAEASATTIVTANAVSFNGSTDVLIEFFAPDCNWSGNAGDLALFWLFDGSSSIGFCATLDNGATATPTRQAVFASVPLTPSNGSHTYSIRATVTNASRTLSVGGGAGGSGARTPGYIRIVRDI